MRVLIDSTVKLDVALIRTILIISIDTDQPKALSNLWLDFSANLTQ